MVRCTLLGNLPCRRGEFDSVVWYPQPSTSSSSSPLIYIHGGYGTVNHVPPSNRTGISTFTYFSDTFELECVTPEMLREEAKKTGRDLLGEFLVTEGVPVFRSRMVMVDDVSDDKCIPPQPSRAGFRLVADGSDPRPHFYMVGGYAGTFLPSYFRSSLFRLPFLFLPPLLFPPSFPYTYLSTFSVLEPYGEILRMRILKEGYPEGGGTADTGQTLKTLVKTAECSACKSVKPKKELRLCGGCGHGGPRYCNRECQKMHWKLQHNAECKRAKQV